MNLRKGLPLGVITPDRDEHHQVLRRETMKKIGGRLRTQHLYNKSRPVSFPDFHTFCSEYLEKPMEDNWHHTIAHDVLMSVLVQDPETGKLMANFSGHKNKKILWMAPRFHAKSQTFAIDYPLWRLYENPNLRIMIISGSEDVAVGFNRAIVNNLENNEKLIKDWGNLRPTNQKKWGERVALVTRDSMEKDPSLVAIGANGKLVSRRADIIIIDDLIDINTARTKTLREKTRMWYENVVIPILESDGELIIVGTAWYRDDIYSQIWDESSFDIKVKLKALMYNSASFTPYKKKGQTYVERPRGFPYKLSKWPKALDIQTVFDKDVIRAYALSQAVEKGVLWHKKWSYEALMDKLKDMSMTSFLRQYMNESSSETEQVFKQRYIEHAMKRGSIKRLVTSWNNATKEPYPDWGHLIIAIGVDLAIKKNARSDESAIAVWGLNEDRDRILLYAASGKWSSDETKMRVQELYDAFNPVKVRVENVGFQELFRRELNEEIPVEGFHTTGSKKFSDESGIAHVAMLFEQGRMIIPNAEGDYDHGPTVRQFVSQLQSYTYDSHAGDILMASWFALHALRDYDQKMTDSRGYFSTAAMVEHMKNMTAPHKVAILKPETKFYKIHYLSLLTVFRSVPMHGEPFISDQEEFFVFVIREERTVAYVVEKNTREIVARAEGSLTILSTISLLEKVGKFFNRAPIIVNRDGEGDAVYLELLKRDYPDLSVMQPDRDGNPVMDEGFTISAANLPLAIDHFKNLTDGMLIKVPDENLLREMGELIKVEGAHLTMSHGTGIRLRAIATALWLIDNYENIEENVKSTRKREKKLLVPYKIFNY